MYWDLRTEDGVGTLTIDDPDESVNTLGSDPMNELEEKLEALEQQTLKGLMITSGKDNNFIAGANIEELQDIANEEEAYEASREGQKLFRRISDLPYPTIAVINGSCLGGGFELTLACDYRIASTNDKTELGCPEVKLGILPGWGGTQRLPRLIGVKNAIDKLLKGSSMDPGEAESLGAVDAVGSPSQIERTARDWIESEEFPDQSLWVWDNYWPVRKLILWQARKQTLSRTNGNMPAPIKIIDSVSSGLGKSLDDALEVEAQNFSELAVTDECSNLIRVFFLREDQQNFSVEGGSEEDLPENIGVIGGGTMGSGIVHWVSSREFETAMVDIDQDAVDAGMDRIENLYQKGVDAGAVSPEDKEQALNRINPSTDYDALDDADLIIEAVVENMDVKQAVFEELENHINEDTVISSNTSALSLEEMAQHLPHPEQMVGLHFFNPVFKMPLIEIVEADSTSTDTLSTAVEFVKGIDKVPIVVKDSPGFLVNRILGPYMNEAGNLLDEGYAIEDVDDALEQFGMPMGPVRLLDEVGIDVAFEVAEYLSDELEVSFELADVFKRIHGDGLTGKKDDLGFYRYDGGDPEPNEDYNPSSPESDPDTKEIRRRCVDLIIAEAVRCLEDDIMASANQLDLAMILGTGFAPFRGGPLKHADNYGLDNVISELETFQELYGDRFQVPQHLRDVAENGGTLTEPPR
ncbi:MAG: 3-hydroxyacyl-CoA dehydrogenase NAD-binding domain-containing protein [bacterium]